MVENEFWAIVDSTRTIAGGQISEQPSVLRELLAQRSDADVSAFARSLSRASTRADTNDIAHAAGLLLGGVADDSFMDFRTWLICHGREVFERALVDPDTIVDLPYDENDFGFGEVSSYVAGELYEERTGDEAPDDDEPDEGTSDEQLYDQATLRARFPRLWARAERRHPEYLRTREERLRRLNRGG